MGEFLNLVSPDQALKKVFNQLNTSLGSELVEINDSLNRVAATDVKSSENLPSYMRSTMDGYSVRASDTFGASESLPALLTTIAFPAFAERLLAISAISLAFVIIIYFLLLPSCAWYVVCSY